MFIAILIAILIAALSVLAVVRTAVALQRDGYRQVPTDRTRLP